MASELKFSGDALYEIIPKPQYGEGICEAHLIMTKEVFKECYERWIQNDGQKNGEENA